jgi:hypothetical protein
MDGYGKSPILFGVAHSARAVIDAEGVVVRHPRTRCVDDERKFWSFSIPTVDYIIESSAVPRGTADDSWSFGMRETWQEKQVGATATSPHRRMRTHAVAPTETTLRARPVVPSKIC